MPSRRRLLEGTLAFAALAGLPGVAPLGATLAPTPRQTAGPFYPSAFPADSDHDLVAVAGRPAPALGTVTHVGGRVTDLAGRPLAGATVEIWQCDANGRYLHPGGRGGWNRDAGFQGYGRTRTDESGAYRFRTIRPVAYAGRTPHIHFAIAAPGFARLITQMYVAGEPGNERDFVLNGIGDPAARARLIVPLVAAPEIEAGALAGSFDIVLGERA